MKKIITFVSFVLAVMLILSGCGAENLNNDFSYAPSESVSEAVSSQVTAESTEPPIPANDNIIAGDPTFDETTSQTSPPTQVTALSNGREFRGMWLASYELAPGRKSMTESEYRQKTDRIMQDLMTLGITDVFVQVRANCDSLYPSQYFKPFPSFEKDGKHIFDGLKIIIESAHAHSMRVHAWLNPYRISADSGVDDSDPIFSSVTESDVYKSGDKAFLKPVSENARRLILNGVREILTYGVDGVHIDDYFYPTSDERIDKTEYEAYVSAGGTMKLGEWRRANVSALISSMYSLVKASGNRIFSISPSGDIDKNQNYLYADVKLWCSTPGYTDLIIPQIYYGFENKHQPFEKCLSEWESIVTCDSVSLAVGLAAYKSGEHDDYADTGENEWVENSDIIRREVECLRGKNCIGFALFSYHHIFVDNNLINTEVQNLKSVL